MKDWKLRQVTRIREAVAHLRNTPHAATCRCCQSDLDAIEEAADSPCAPHWLSQVGKRITDAGSTTRTRAG